ncbi:MAG: hypothetical protein OEQ47_08510 [Acidimicrobiia bacterium]|nr:hypothetical protein [Acidimicrobiia bacterium]
MSSASDYDLDVAADVGRVRTSRRLDGSWDWFQRLWGIAVVAHIVGNPATGQIVGAVTARGVASFALGLTAVAAVLRADDRRLLAALALGVPVTAILEAPVLGNHWLLASAVSLGVVVALVRDGGWDWFGATARAMFLAFYGFAVFSKLNEDFFDPSVSCAVVYANQSRAAMGLPGLVSGSWPTVLLPLVVVLVEALVLLSLTVRRTRFAGVVLGLVFHSLISFDLGQHFYDFTSVLFPLFLLFIFQGRLDRLGEYLPERTQTIVGITLCLFVVASVLPRTQVTSVILDTGFFFVWIPYAIGMVTYVARLSVGRHEFALRPHGLIAWSLILLIGLNGLMPYLEIKTANSWNMYSNLTVVNGESNHLLVRSGFPVLGGHGDLIEVISTEDPGLRPYVGSEWRLTDRALESYLARNPGVEVEYLQGGVTSVRSSTLDPSGPSVTLRDLAVLRAVDASAPSRCQTVWLPAN